MCMNKISCDICMDLMPLVTDGVASEDSERAVREHVEGCESCRELFNSDEKPAINAERVDRDIKKRLTQLGMILIVIGVLFGIGIAEGQFMFYNIIIMPTIGAVSYLALKRKWIYSLLFVLVAVYVRWVPDTIGYIFDANDIYEVLMAFLPPLWWALIYASVFGVGVVIAGLLKFGFSKEEKET